MADRHPDCEPPPLRTRVLRELRAARHPLDTGWLARRCAEGAPHAVQQVNSLLNALLRMRVVVRRRPVRRGEGRPAWRWELRVTADTEGFGNG